MGISLAACDPVSAARTMAQPADWPRWAPAMEAFEQDIERLRGEAVDIRKFGALLDGRTDAAPAFAKAIDSGARAVLIPSAAGGALFVSTPIRIDRSFAVIGANDAVPIRCQAPGEGVFAIAPSSRRPEDFVRGVVFAGLTFENTDLRASGRAISASNVRGLTVANCTARRLSLALVHHLREDLGLYKRRAGSRTSDPAVMAGFSARSVDDLNEDIAILGNTVDYGRYQGDILRFHFSRRVLVHGNSGSHAKVSWWGGGGKHAEGGAVNFLRRVRQVYVADNRMTGCNGGVYGNNGQDVIAARNVISDMTDVGVDFEGCFDCVAYENDCRNIANFCYATFFAARNIVFHDNYAEQDGSAAQLWEKFGKGRYGRPRGIYFAALRSAGFAGVADSISVSFRRNRFVYRGPGLGGMVPSYFNELAFEDNVLTNATCDWSYQATGNLSLRGNRLEFETAAAEPHLLLGGSARDGVVADNIIAVRGALAPGSVAIGYTVRTPKARIALVGNIVRGSDAPLAVSGDAQPLSLRIEGNEIAAMSLAASNDPARTGNAGANGQPRAIAPLATLPPAIPD